MMNPDKIKLNDIEMKRLFITTMTPFFTLTGTAQAPVSDHFSPVSVRNNKPVAAVPGRSHPVLTKPANRAIGVFQMGRGRFILKTKRTQLMAILDAGPAELFTVTP